MSEDETNVIDLAALFKILRDKPLSMTATEALLRAKEEGVDALTHIIKESQAE